ncbi:carboxymuconolactone decarboxylase family protein [soil metagenome]
MVVKLVSFIIAARHTYQCLKVTDMSKLPTRFVKFQQTYPNVFNAYETLGQAASEAGPLDKKQIALVKLGIAAGARLEGAVHSHCRRALEAGATADEIRHVILLAVTTLGFPSMMAGLSWVDEILDGKKPEPVNAK